MSKTSPSDKDEEHTTPVTQEEPSITSITHETSSKTSSQTSPTTQDIAITIPVLRRRPLRSNIQPMIDLYDSQDFRTFVEDLAYRWISKFRELDEWSGLDLDVRPFGTSTGLQGSSLLGDSCFIHTNRIRVAYSELPAGSSYKPTTYCKSPIYKGVPLRLMNMGKYLLLGCRMIDRHSWSLIASGKVSIVHYYKSNCCSRSCIFSPLQQD